MDGKRRWTSPGVTGRPALHRLWRTVGPGALAPDIAQALRVTVGAAFADAGREDPMTFDAPRVVREAQAAITRCGLPHPESDVAITAVLAHALRGDEDAALFLADALDRFASSEGGGTHHARFAREWRTRSAHPPSRDDPDGQ